MNERRIWGFGSVAIDFRVRTPDLGENYKEKLLAQETWAMGGGACANALVQAARLGAQSGWLGKLGCDRIGDMIRDMLSQEGVDCQHILSDDKMLSPFNIAAYAGEQMLRRCGIMLPNSLNSLTNEDLKALVSAVRPGDIVHVELGEISAEHVLGFLRLCREKGAFTVLDIDLDPVRQCGCNTDTLNGLFSFVDLLMPNAAALHTVFPGCGHAEIARRLHRSSNGKPVVLTQGSAGAILLEKGSAEVIPAYPLTDLCDTVGAGDAFHGGVIFALSRGKNLRDAVRLGSACGAMNCLQFGARSGMPDLKQVTEFMEKMNHG